MSLASVIKLAISLAIPLTVGAIAGMFTSQAVPEWYAALNRPSYAPPNWLFGPVWTTLYVLLGISLFLVWNTEASRVRNLAITIFIIQMLLNFAWSFIFFYYKQPGWALVEIIVLLFAIVLMVVTFHKVKPVAAYLNIPYLLWVSFATLLTAGYYVLNRGH